MYLARRSKNGFVSVENIATDRGIPYRFLEQIFLILKRGRYVKSIKGKHGGYRLAKDPDKITLAEVIRLLDGALAPTESVSRYFYEPTPIEKEKALLSLFREIRDFVSDKLENTTLADVCG
jgi:Rrf2 family protein